MPQAETSEAYSSDKGRALMRLSLIIRRKVKKKEEVICEFASNHIHHDGFLNLSQRRDSMDKHSKPFPVGAHQRIWSTIIRRNPFRPCCCK